MCSSGPFYVVPAFLDAIRSRFGMDLGQLGIVAGAERLAIALSCTATGVLIGRLGWRTMLTPATTIVSLCALACFLLAVARTRRVMGGVPARTGT